MANIDNITDERRLWIGNLDSRITEYQLLKILQNYGDIEKFDLLFHRSGPLAGQPRGYAFVTYKDEKASIKVLEKLHGKQILGTTKNVSVRLAKNINYDELMKPKPKIEIPVLAAGSSKTATVNEPKTLSKQIAIQTIEAKLKYLENRSVVDDFELNKPRANEIPLIQKYQYNKNNTQGNQRFPAAGNSSKQHSTKRYNNKPYNRTKR